MTTLGSADGVRRILGRSSSDLTDDEVEPFIEDAARYIRAKTGNDYVLDKLFATSIQASGATNRVYGTYFPMAAASTVKVYIEGVQSTSGTGHTVDFTTSTVTVAAATPLSDGDLVGIFYRPEFFDDWANHLAAQRMASRSLVDVSNSQGASSIVNEIRKTVEDYDKMLMRKPHMTTFADHAENPYDIF
jgi:hypothetical protein